MQTTTSRKLPRGTAADIEAAFRIELPQSLRAALLVDHGADAHKEPLLWAPDEIIRQNDALRNSVDLRVLYMPFDHLLFIAAAGDGDLYALAIDADRCVRRDDVFRWNHENDSRAWFAAHLAGYFEARRRA